MAARAIGSGTISFGLVSIPVKLYAVASPHQLSFHMLHDTCGNRVRMQYYCPFDDEVVQRRDLVRGFEHAKNEFVRFTNEELARLESERTDRLDIVQFVPADSVDLAFIADTHYVGPAKGGERAYKLLADAMARAERVAIGRFGARGREQLVMLRPYHGGLVVHRIHYGDEVRSMDEVDYPRSVAFREGEVELSDRLVEQLSAETFDPALYPDEYQRRVLSAVEEKVAGKEVTVAPEQPQAQVIDLFEALKRSLTGGTAGGAGAETRPGVKKAEPREPREEAGGGRKRGKQGTG